MVAIYQRIRKQSNPDNKSPKEIPDIYISHYLHPKQCYQEPYRTAPKEASSSPGTVEACKEELHEVPTIKQLLTYPTLSVNADIYTL